MILAENTIRKLVSFGIYEWDGNLDESHSATEGTGIKPSTMKNLDSYERVDLEQIVYTTYQKSGVVSGMPKSVFGDSFGYDMQREISGYMKDYYSGEVSQDELKNYFADCCKEMRIYRTQQHQTSGSDIEDNRLIVSQMYEIFAKENQRAARVANYQEGKELNASSYPNTRNDDWSYYNADYYYQCEDTKSILQSAVSDMTDKWELSSIDVKEIECNSQYTLDGGFDFNSGWNFTYRNQIGRSSMTDETIAPPKGFKLFYKENKDADAEDMNLALRGSMTISMGNYVRTADIPFYISRDSLEGQIFNASELFTASKEDGTAYKECIKFLENITVFTRWYSWESGINNHFGNYIPRYS